jgi:hypothetical protein
MEVELANGIRVIRVGTRDTVLLNGVACLWVATLVPSSTREDKVSIEANFAFSDEEILSVFLEYVHWRRLNPPGAAS